MNKYLIVGCIVVVCAGVVVLGVQYFNRSVVVPVVTTPVVVTPVPTTPVSTALPAQYVTSVDAWPPQVTPATGAYVCTVGGSTIAQGGNTTEKVINGHTYCVTVESEGAAGSTYATYTYESAQGAVRHKLMFVLRRVQCMNYDEPNQSACIKTQKEFDVDAVADSLISQAH